MGPKRNKINKNHNSSKRRLISIPFYKMFVHMPKDFASNILFSRYFRTIASPSRSKTFGLYKVVRNRIKQFVRIDAKPNL
jgi:hypothetical protein